MGSEHAHIISRDVPGAALQVICDVSEAMARQLADPCGARDISVNATETIGRRDVDAVLIASPDSTHAGLMLSALNVRKPVLCEKPLALTPAESLSVVDAECAIGRQLVQVGFMRRFDPGYIEMKSALQSGRIGTAVMMHNFHRNVAAPAGFNGWMAITNSAPHEFDAVRYVLDAEIVAISAFEPVIGGNVICKPVVLVMETSRGQLATIEINNNAGYGYDVRGELVGTDGSVTLATCPNLRIDRDLMSTTSYAADWRSRFREAYRLQNQAWIRAIVTGIPAEGAAHAWDGHCANVIAEAGAAALSSGQKVAAVLPQSPALYSKVRVAA